MSGLTETMNYNHQTESISMDEDDDDMEMEIDETVPDTPIIENKYTLSSIINESPTILKESPTIVKDTPLVTDETPKRVNNSSLIAKESSTTLKESSTVKESAVIVDESATTTKESTETVIKSPAIANNSLGIVKDSPVIAKESPASAKESSTVTEKSPLTNCVDAPNSTTPNHVDAAPSKESDSTKNAADDDDDDIVIIDAPDTIPKPKPAQTLVEKPKPKPPQPADNDVVILDDDDIQNNNSSIMQRSRRIADRLKRRVPDVLECEVIDLVEKTGSANSKCINYACGSGVNMMIAPLFCLTFYRVKSSENKVREVCTDCFYLAMVHYDNLSVAMQQNKFLIECDIPIRSDVVEIEDSDSEEEVDKEVAEHFDNKNMKIIMRLCSPTISKVKRKNNYEEQITKAVVALKKHGAVLKDKFKEVDTQIHENRKRLDVVHHDLYSEFKVRYENLPPIDIMDVFYPNARPVIRSPSESNIPENERRSPRKTKPISYVELDEPGSSSNSPIVSERADTKEVTEETAVIPDLPPKGPLFKPPPKLNDIFYSVRFGTLGSWVRVRLTNILKPGSMVNNVPIEQPMYCVTTESKQQNKIPTTRLVTGKEIAYTFPSNVSLEVGTRVIAVFREITSTGESKKPRKEAFFPGIVAEPLYAANNYRYLIFFDDGYAQYVDFKMVHLICEQSENVWEDMHIDSRLFIKKYMESYPERPMVKLRKDQTVRTEYNGKWWDSTVMNIDCSLVQMFFEASNRVEWIYRGSTRLNPMFKEEQAATNRQINKKRTLKKYNECGPYVQYTRNDPNDIQENGENQRSVARKTTSKPPQPGKIPETVPFLPINDRAALTLQAPPPSKVVYFTPRTKSVQVKFQTHLCSVRCKNFVTYDVKKLRGYNPLSKPLLCGWNRLIYRHKGKRVINYKAPCGKLVRSLEELHIYLQDSKSEMTVDLFDFDFWVHCLAEFVLERNSTINKDMSNGLELVTIPVVNYIDNDLNTFCNYSIKREPMEGVHLNLDPEFLCGCDCDDDCQDKMKCHCWQLTLEGREYLGKNVSPDSIGYVFRRLPEPVATGIYECNSRCRCASTCLNRVVQNPLQLKLQVFKTNNRGWGIRCLNDIPQGAFICIYAGSILTEQMANEGGQNYGDEYLAELDYIEVVEKVKEDYEEEVEMDVEDEKEDTRSQAESIEEENSEFNRNNRKKTIDDIDFIPPVLVPKGQSDSAYKSRLRKRTFEEMDKEDKEKVENGEKKDDEDETVVVSDDEDAFREPSSFNPKNESELDDTRPSLYKSVRQMFAQDECVYVMDAKVTGNIGRFLNHSCSPNVFVQNVFVDTHDLRFPWVAFFALTFIRAGTELTWNYNYDVGSVPGKVLYCQCSSQDCRGRLL